MHDINKELKKYPYTNDFPNYHPHCTIAYLKKDSAEKYCKLIKKMLPLDFDASKFVYSKTNGQEISYDLD